MSWQLRNECERREVERLAAELEVSEVLASVLARRGFDDPARARAFLAAELPEHDPFELGDMREACEAIRAAVAAGTRICVHGDYDADGICATALAVLVLRELGAEVSYHLPSRFDEGYGVSGETLTRLAGEGVGLVLTVDCGVTAVAEVAHARELGLDVVVTDHHRPGDELPACPVVGPYRGDYPFRELCGTGVVWKLGQALLGADSEALARHLDLVAVATVADVVPLLDENRGLAVAGLRALARTQKPGLRELMRVARVDPAAVDAGTIGFRLAPRLNAAGRLGRPEAALELLLTEEREQAARARPAARGAQPRPAGRRGADPARGGRGDRVVAGGPAPPPRLRGRRRRLARRRDRDRRLAPGRALRAAGRADRRHRRRLEGLGPLDRRLRPARRPAAVRGPPRALGRARRRGRPVDQARERPGLRRGVRGGRRRRARRTTTCARRRSWTRWSTARS